MAFKFGNKEHQDALEEIKWSIAKIQNSIRRKNQVLIDLYCQVSEGCAVSKARIPSIKRDIEKLNIDLEAQKLLRDLL